MQWRSAISRRRVRCPICGQCITRPYGLDLAGHELSLFLILFEAFPRAVACDDVVERLYAHRRDGGPTSARLMMSMAKSNLDRKLRLKGWRIESRPGPNSFYRLTKIYP